MPLTATKSQTAKLLGVCEDKVDNLLQQGLLRRTEGNRWVHVTLDSIALYTGLPLEVVVREFSQVDQKPTEPIAAAGIPKQTGRRWSGTKALPECSVYYPVEASYRRSVGLGIYHGRLPETLALNPPHFEPVDSIPSWLETV